MIWELDLMTTAYQASYHEHSQLSYLAKKPKNETRRQIGIAFSSRRAPVSVESIADPGKLSKLQQSANWGRRKHREAVERILRGAPQFVGLFIPKRLGNKQVPSRLASG